MGRRTLLSALLVVIPGCGGAVPPPQPVRDDGGELRTLGLTTELPAAYRRACERFADYTPLGLDGPACPAVVPIGRLSVELAGPLDRSKAHRATFNLDLGSRSLGRVERRRIDAAGGHWTIVAARGRRPRAILRQRLRVPDSGCRREPLEGRRVDVCRVPPYEDGGGYYGGHAAVAWADGDVTFHITAHGYANEGRVLTIAASLIRERRRWQNPG